MSMACLDWYSDWRVAFNGTILASAYMCIYDSRRVIPYRT